jgi:peptidoglycan/LPS O-acetylase OafA/YrhL
MLGYLAVCLGGCLLIPAAEVGSPMSGWQFAREALLLEYMPLLIIGMLLQQIRFEGVRKGPYIAAIIAAVAVFHICDRHGHNPAITVLLTAILWLAAYGKLPVLRLKPLMFISTISYSLYLLHDNLGCFVIYHLNQNGVPPVMCFALIIPIVLLLSLLSSRCLERPLSGLLKSGWQRAQAWMKTSSVPLANPLPQTKR